MSPFQGFEGCGTYRGAAPLADVCRPFRPMRACRRGARLYGYKSYSLPVLPESKLWDRISSQASILRQPQRDFTAFGGAIVKRRLGEGPSREWCAELRRVPFPRAGRHGRDMTQGLFTQPRLLSGSQAAPAEQPPKNFDKKKEVALAYYLSPNQIKPNYLS